MTRTSFPVLCQSQLRLDDLLLSREERNESMQRSHSPATAQATSIVG